IQRWPISGRAAHDVLRLSAIDVVLHAVVVPGLPEQTDLLRVVFLLPRFVVLHHVRQQVFHKGIVLMHALYSPDAVSKPTTVIAGLRPWGPKPILRVVTRVARIAEPANFIELVTGGATDGAIRARPEWAIDEFGKAVAALGGTVC